jgi:isopentenyl phosphate kinase
MMMVMMMVVVMMMMMMAMMVLALIKTMVAMDARPSVSPIKMIGSECTQVVKRRTRTSLWPLMHTNVTTSQDAHPTIHIVIHTL